MKPLHLLIIMTTVAMINATVIVFKHRSYPCIYRSESGLTYMTVCK